MYNVAVLRKLSKILLVEADFSAGQRKAKFLRSEGTAVDVVEYSFQALTRLGDPNHGYNLVFLGNRLLYPDAAKRQILSDMHILD